MRAFARSRALRLSGLAASIGCGVALFALPAAGKSADIGCPGAPSGWTSSPQNPQLWGPEQSAGLDNETVTCVYVNGKGLTFTVKAQFALPIDINPINDFVFGCGTSSVAWNTSDREYLLASTDRWSYVVFEDPLSILSSDDVTQFESLSKTFLQSTQGVAHTCKLKVAPTAVTNRWQFSFQFGLTRRGFSATGVVGSHTANQVEAQAVDDGQFETTDAGRTPKIKSVKPILIPIAVTDGGKKHTVTIRLTAGVSYRYEEASLAGGIETAKAKLTTRVAVVRSSEPACRAKSVGTLEISTLPSRVVLHLCGALFGQGKHSDVVYISQG